MSAEERVVGGLRCGEVLADLGEYLDRALPAERVSRIEEHLRGCDWCERFGREFAETVGALRARLAAPPALEAGIAERLRRKLDESDS
jgi:anti-sigma factor RsiW